MYLRIVSVTFFYTIDPKPLVFYVIKEQVIWLSTVIRFDTQPNDLFFNIKTRGFGSNILSIKEQVEATQLGAKPELGPPFRVDGFLVAAIDSI